MKIQVELLLFKWYGVLNPYIMANDHSWMIKEVKVIFIKLTKTIIKSDLLGIAISILKGHEPRLYEALSDIAGPFFKFTIVKV